MTFIVIYRAEAIVVNFIIWMSIVNTWDIKSEMRNI